jgi:DNA polymerase III epsilon subunit-like protein
MIVIDIETTGTDPRHHAIISIGALDFENPTNQFYSECSISPEAKIDPEALPIIGFSEEELRDQTKQSPFILMSAFIEWMSNIDDRTPAGLHISGFDLQFLALTAEANNLEWPLGHRCVDLHSMMYVHLKLHDPDMFSLKNQRANIYGNFIQKYCGLDSVPRPHNALMDAKWEAECFARLMYGKKLLPEFNDQEIPTKLLKNG